MIKIQKYRNLFQLLRRLFKFTIWLIYVLIILELFTRFFLFIAGEDIDVYRNFSFTRLPNIFIKDSLTQYRMKPNSKGAVLTSDFQITYEINNLGLRENDVANEKTCYRILFLGDSFTFAEGVPIGERFSDLVGKAFPNVETINAGVPGYGINNMCSWYKHYSEDIKADLVLCCIVECDIDRAIYAHLGEKGKHIISKDRLSKNTLGSYILKSSIYHYVINYINYFFQKSYFYCYFSVKYKIFRMARSLEKRDQEIWTKAMTNARERSIKDKYLKDKYREMVSRQIFHALYKITSQRNAKLAVINIDDHYIEWLPRLLKELNITYIDNSSYLINAENIRYKIDRHYNSYGNELIGKALISQLQDIIPAQIIEQK